MFPSYFYPDKDFPHEIIYQHATEYTNAFNLDTEYSLIENCFEEATSQTFVLEIPNIAQVYRKVSSSWIMAQY